jgi:hypothetical protein
MVTALNWIAIAAAVVGAAALVAWFVGPRE